MPGVFDIKSGSRYDDEISVRYHFPISSYLREVEALVGDFVVYRETRRSRGDQQGYTAAARVSRIESDPVQKDHAYAYVDNFLVFPETVPLRPDGIYAEKALRQLVSRKLVGPSLRGKSVRIIDFNDFEFIVSLGLRISLEEAGIYAPIPDLEKIDIEANSDARLSLDDRPIARVLLNRKVRDAAFRKQVCEAYDFTCAVTGLRIINGGGKAEVQAAHIVPVEANGPDIVQNGIALSGTIHWLFDRHLISISNDYRLLVSHNKIPSELQTLFRSQLNKIHLPYDKKLRPRRDFLKYHREAFCAK